VFRNARGLPATIRRAALAVHRVLAAPPSIAAQTPVFLAHDPDVTDVSGGFFGPGRRRRRIPQRVLRPDRRAALWAASEDLVRPWLSTAGSLKAGTQNREHRVSFFAAGVETWSTGSET
jgi:hypothetical protein